MKTRSLVVSLMIFIIHSSLAAQITFSVGGGTGMSSLPDRHGNYHASFATSLLFSDAMELGVAIGYQRFLSAFYQTGRYDIDPGYRTLVVPLTLQLRLFLVQDSWQPYAQLNVGATLMQWNFNGYSLFATSTAEYAPSVPIKYERREWYPTISMGIGMLADLNNSLAIDLALHLGMVAGGANSQEIYVAGRPPEGFPFVSRNAKEWNYLRLYAGVRFTL